MPATLVNCHAKINLGLLIGPRLPDGYHELRTIFQTIGLHDELRMEVARRAAAPTVEMVCDIPELATADNLAARAARMILDELGMRRSVRLRLKKAIPAGGGLAGGSSDAAAVLRSLPALLGKRPPLGRLMELGAQLGADVPFFLIGGRALGLGRGDEVYPLPDPPAATVLLVHPGLHISTADAYRRLDNARDAAAAPGAALTTGSVGPMISFCCGGESRRSVDRLRNDFEPVIFSAYPELARLQRVLIRAGASPALLSGSGSAMFGIFDSGRAAGVAASEIRRRWPQWRIWMTRTVSRRRLAASLSST
jgi:4-diphosphocytidyl-2-C-methyl-D-erythritol kinase